MPTIERVRPPSRANGMCQLKRKTVKRKCRLFQRWSYSFVNSINVSSAIECHADAKRSWCRSTFVETITDQRRMNTRWPRSVRHGTRESFHLPPTHLQRTPSTRTSAGHHSPVRPPPAAEASTEIALSFAALGMVGGGCDGGSRSSTVTEGTWDAHWWGKCKQAAHRVFDCQKTEREREREWERDIWSPHSGSFN